MSEYRTTVEVKEVRAVQSARPTLAIAELLGAAGLLTATAIVGGGSLVAKGACAGMNALRKARETERTAVRALLRPISSETLLALDPSASIVALAKSGARVTDAPVLAPMIARLKSRLAEGANGRCRAEAAAAANELVTAVAQQHCSAMRDAAFDVLVDSVRAAKFDDKLTPRRESGYILGENARGESVRIDVFGDCQTGEIGVAMDAAGFRDSRCRDALDEVENQARKRGLNFGAFQQCGKPDRLVDGRRLPSHILNSCG